MQKFFRNAGLTPTKSQACAEEAICQEAHNPRKLFKYVHEVADFSLMNLGKIVLWCVLFGRIVLCCVVFCWIVLCCVFFCFVVLSFHLK